MQPALLLRQEILKKRDQMDQEERIRKSRAIQDRLFSLKKFQDGKTICTYVNFRSEVTTRGIIEQLLSNGKTVAVPVTRVREKRLDIIAISDLKKDLAPGYCGILEPTEDIIEKGMLSLQDIDTILLPGSVFDRRGGRFGYGGGYYDRLLSRIPAALRIALAFDLQVTEQLPLQDHDELLDMVITESTLISNLKRRRHRQCTTKK